MLVVTEQYPDPNQPYIGHVNVQLQDNLQQADSNHSHIELNKIATRHAANPQLLPRHY
jgi:hypothetical protein